MATKGAFQCAFDKCTSSIRTDFREEWLEIITNTRKIGLNRLPTDMAALECDIITEGLGCGVNRHVMQPTKSQI